MVAGFPIDEPAGSPSSPGSLQGAMRARKARPRGVTALSLLWWLSALLNFVSGYLAAAFPERFALALGPVGDALARLSGGIILLAVIQVATGIGLWLTRPWARTVAIAFALAGLANFPVGTGMGVLLLAYLFRPLVREAFEGRGRHVPGG